ncbi:MAG: GlcNAc-PI de-N-acetylase [Rhodospirillaceae bacterium]|nr:MAG: GlcNAc-PI de-N-acetylase [Rhodospirillaceae bacterium]
MTTNVTVIAAHPDDEVLGMSGTLARHRAMGDRVCILFMSDGVTGRDVVYDPVKRADEIEARRKAAQASADLIGVESIEFEGYPNLRMDRESLLDVTQRIEKRLERWDAEIVYTHHASDVNIDHRVTFDATLVACRPVPGRSIRSIRCFELGASTDYSVPTLGHPFEPNLFIDISDYLDIRRQMIECYDFEMRPAPFPRSQKILDANVTVRGSQVGLDAAEAFMEIRRIIR